MPGQPDQLDITLAFALKASARRNAIEVAINVYLEQRRRMIAWPSSLQRRNPTKAKLAKIKTFNESINRTNRIVLGHVVVQHGWEKCALAPVNPFHIAGHPSLPPAELKRIIASKRLFTQPGPIATFCTAVTQRAISGSHRLARSVRTAIRRITNTPWPLCVISVATAWICSNVFCEILAIALMPGGDRVTCRRRTGIICFRLRSRGR